MSVSTNVSCLHRFKSIQTVHAASQRGFNGKKQERKQERKQAINSEVTGSSHNFQQSKNSQRGANKQLKLTPCAISLY